MSLKNITIIFPRCGNNMKKGTVTMDALLNLAAHCEANSKKIKPFLINGQKHYKFDEKGWISNE